VLSLISGVIQIIFLIIKNVFERNADKKKKKAELKNEAVEAVKSRDISRINVVIGKLRK
jgi:hypothetical protein